MTNDTFRATMKEIEDQLKSYCDERLDAAMTTYRRSWIRAADQWCCHTMQGFAVKVWGMNAPHDPEGFGTLSLRLRGTEVIFCPFCGVKL